MRSLTELLAWLITISCGDGDCVQLKHKCHHLCIVTSVFLCVLAAALQFLFHFYEARVNIYNCHTTPECSRELSFMTKYQVQRHRCNAQWRDCNCSKHSTSQNVAAVKLLH